MRNQVALLLILISSLGALFSGCAHSETASGDTQTKPSGPHGQWEKRIVGQGPGCNGGVLPYDPTGAPCYPSENRYPANCYYYPKENGNQIAFSCPVPH